jgi:SAM-dependent methyltransferase
MHIDNQNEYWDSVANAKTFTHPIDIELLEKFVDRQHNILDFGCGYGRITKELLQLGFSNVIGFDTSEQLIKRGKSIEELPIFHINQIEELPIECNSIDCVLLFAVLTCIPSNHGQKELVNLLRSKLKKDAIFYISDYYLQENSTEMERYTFLNNDKDNYGVFELSEGVTFRHHTKDWLSMLLKDFTLLEEKIITVNTMNGHQAKAFQMLLRKV